jgi:hypothetical protein
MGSRNYAEGRKKKGKKRERVIEGMRQRGGNGQGGARRGQTKDDDPQNS